MAASPEPMANVTEIVVFTLIPISCAAPLSSDTARMAVPIFVLLVNSISTTIIRMHTAMVTSVTWVMRSVPRLTDPLPTTEVKLTGVDVQISSAAFCRK